MNYSKEIQRSLIHKEGSYGFENTLSWRDAALQILKHINWSPECSQSWSVNIKKLLPPEGERRKVFPGIFHEEIPNWKPCSFKFDERDKKIEVFATPVTIDTMGMVIGILKYENRTIQREIKVCGQIITKEPPQYMNEYVVGWALKFFRSHKEKGETPQRLLHKPTIYAGSTRLIFELRDWYQKGDLRLTTAAAPELIEEIAKLDALMETSVVIRPNQIKDETEDLQCLPAVQQELLKAAEEFRVIALKLLGGNEWIRGLPRLPLTKQELKDHVKLCMDSDELRHLKKLAELGSESAEIIKKLNLTRGHIAEAMSRLKHSHPAQITLASILCGTRFKFAFQGVLIPTECPNGWGRKEDELCGEEDSFEHLISCHGLRKYIESGPYIVDFLVRMAKRATPMSPGINIPKYIV